MSLTEQPQAVDIFPELDNFIDACRDLDQTHSLSHSPAAWNLPSLGGHLRVSKMSSDGRETGCVIQVEIRSGTLQIIKQGRMIIISLNGHRVEPTMIVGEEGNALKVLLGSLIETLPDAESARSADLIHRETGNVLGGAKKLLSDVTRGLLPKA